MSRRRVQWDASSSSASFEPAADRHGGVWASSGGGAAREVGVIDYQGGNLYSVCKAIEHIGATPRVLSSPREILDAEVVVLPGVGAFDAAMREIRKRDMEGPIKDAVAQGKPFLGICLGLQLLFDSSEEGTSAGLGILPGSVRRFKREPEIAIPHMGWNTLTLTQPNCPLWAASSPNPWVYFVHSYYVDPTDPAVVAATVTHGTQTVCAAAARDNVAAVQFHPEKSGDGGLNMLRGFIAHAFPPSQ